MSYTPFNAPLLAPILGDFEVSSMFSVKSELDSIIKFENALASAQLQLGMISDADADSIDRVLSSFKPDMEKLSTKIASDGMVVPGLVHQIREMIDEKHAHAFHLYCTSQDVIDSSGMMRMQNAMAIILERLNELVTKFRVLSDSEGANSLMGFTRMQAAIPITGSDRIGDWISPLLELGSSVSRLQFPIQLGGPVGRSDAYDGRAKELSEIMAKDLNLSAPPRSWQNNRMVIIEIGNWLSMLTGHLAKIGKDITLMAQMGDEHILLSAGGSSSAMAHKRNPVLAELLVSLAHYNAGLISTLHGCLIHEQERSGAAWAVEWMTMPQLFVTTAAALRNATNLVGTIERIGKSP